MIPSCLHAVVFQDASTVDFSALGDIKTNVSFVQMLNQRMVARVVANWELVDPRRTLKIPTSTVKVKRLFANNYLFTRCSSQ
jgi:hypothetical protein